MMLAHRRGAGGGGMHGDGEDRKGKKRGNNKHGAKGTRKCNRCRHMKQKCRYDDPAEDCMLCARAEVFCGSKEFTNPNNSSLRERQDTTATSIERFIPEIIRNKTLARLLTMMQMQADQVTLPQLVRHLPQLVRQLEEIPVHSVQSPDDGGRESPHLPIEQSMPEPMPQPILPMQSQNNSADISNATQHYMADQLHWYEVGQHDIGLSPTHRRQGS